MSVEAAFTVGWVVWFASIVAAVLYAIGFASFALLLAQEAWPYIVSTAVPDWLGAAGTATALAITTTVLLGVSLMLRSAGGGAWANVLKVIVFGVLILGGLWAMTRQPIGVSSSAMRPFLTQGWGGLVQAMGYTFIALQGFDLIAAVGGEVRNPAKTIPRSMLLSLVIALLIYLPLLLVLVTVGVPPGQVIAAAAAANPEAIVAIAARQYLGTAGYWLVIVAGVLSMFTALQANLFAASRIALSMSRDHTLPAGLSRLSTRGRTPWVAVLVTMTLVALLIVLLPDVAAAGAASSLIFLVTFAIAHWLTILVRQRSPNDPPPFRTPAFPAVPILGGLACLSLAVFQGIAVPSAGGIALTWLTAGGLLFLTLFARRARLTDASNVAMNPDLAQLRGVSPLVLVPIANPQNARAMIALADTLVPAAVGRVLVQTIVVTPSGWSPDDDAEPTRKLSAMLETLLRVSAELSIRCETLTTVSAEPMEEIARVARLHRCESVLLGLSEIGGDEAASPLERLMGQLSNDVVVLRAPKNWRLSDSDRIVVPVGGRGGHDYLLTRLLGSLSRKQKRSVHFIRVVGSHTDATQRQRILRDLDRTACYNAGAGCDREVVVSDNPVEAITQRAGQSGLVIVGVQRIGPREKLFGKFTRELAQQTTGPIIVISRRG